MLIYLAMIEGPEERSKFEQIYEKYRALMFYRARQIRSTRPLSVWRIISKKFPTRSVQKPGPWWLL